MKLKLFFYISLFLYFLVAIIYTEERPVYITYTLINKSGIDFDRIEYNTDLMNEHNNPNLTTEVTKEVGKDTYTFKQKVILRRKPLLFVQSFKKEPKFLTLILINNPHYNRYKAQIAFKALKSKQFKYDLLKSDIVKETKNKS